MKKMNRLILMSILCCFFPMILGLFYYPSLPDRMAIHFNFQNVPDNWYPKFIVLFILPLILLIAHVFCLYCTFKDTKNVENQVMIHIVIWITPVLSNALSMILIAYALGKIINISFFIRFLIALLFIILGNYLPKSRVSNTIGIRLPWTVNNPEVWRKTHRMAGYLWLIGGLVLLCTLPFDSGVLFIILVFTMVIIPMGYSYYLAHK